MTLVEQFMFDNSKFFNGGCEIGELTDGYHTYDDLYHQRAVLFAALCNTFKDLAWKSRKHADGEECFGGGWFIVGIKCPDGEYTYHYKNNYWEFFHVKELDTAPEWDGHTSSDVDRVLKLKNEISTIDPCMSTMVVGVDIDGVPKQLVWEHNKESIVYDKMPEPLESNEETSDTQEEKSQAVICAENEVNFAKEFEKKNSNSEDSLDGYGEACYESALKAYRSLCEDGHSGMSIVFTKMALNRLIDHKCLTPIEDTDDVWNECDYNFNDYKTYQCKRMSSLFKDVWGNGEVVYTDVNRVRGCYLNGDGSTWHSRLLDKIMDEIVPIKFPYYPVGTYMVHIEECLVDTKNGDYDTIAVHSYSLNNGPKIPIKKAYKEVDHKWKEITWAEWKFRLLMSYKKGRR